MNYPSLPEGHSSPVGHITQAELETYRELKRRAEEIEGDLKVARDSFLSRRYQGIEAGPLTLRVDTRTTRSFSYDAIADLVGRKEADRLKFLLPERSTQVLTVTAS